jgi:sporulation protein YlmC with PRC-barrel domain
MLRNIKELEDYSIGATDGVLGRVQDFYFDDERWAIRYLVVEIGAAAARRKVLISPIGIGRPNRAGKILPLALTRHQVDHSPDIDTDKPVSRQQEMGYLGYYGYGTYWGGGGLWGAGLYPDMLQGGLQGNGSSPKNGDARERPECVHASKTVPGQHEDPHLRSVNELLRYYVHAADGDLGHVHGLLVDDKSWAIRYLIINTSNWWLGHEVLVAPQWIDHLSWAESMVFVDLTRQAIKAAPPYDSTAPLNDEQEAGMRAHYGRD